GCRLPRPGLSRRIRSVTPRRRAPVQRLEPVRGGVQEDANELHAPDGGVAPSDSVLARRSRRCRAPRACGGGGAPHSARTYPRDRGREPLPAAGPPRRNRPRRPRVPRGDRAMTRETAPSGRTAIIVGAGIAGLATALSLARAKWSVIVLERAARLRGGAFVVGFSGMGYEAATRLGLAEELRARASPWRPMQQVDGDGRVLARMSEASQRALTGHRTVSIL